jgi:hypothetical protein
MSRNRTPGRGKSGTLEIASFNSNIRHTLSQSSTPQRGSLALPAGSDD